MIMGSGNAETSSFEMTLETIEFSTAKLDSMLFEIPAGYTLAKNIEELQDRMDAASIAALYEKKKGEENSKGLNSAEPKTAGVLRIGVVEPGSVEGLQASELQVYLVSTLTGNKVEAVAVASAEDAKGKGCSLLLTSTVTQVKAASKVGSVLKAVRNVDPSAALSYNIEAQLSLSNLSDGATRSQKKIAGKFEGTADGATKKALEEGSRALLKELN
jgi:hypothetical protein